MSQRAEITTTVAMLVSVFGEPLHADSEANMYEWSIEFPDGAKALIRNLDKQDSAGRVQRWEIISDSDSAIEQCNEKLDEGKNYYEGTLHPELFIKRKK
ncbi:MAG: hypothetical protein R3332_11665 [Pseudohongiellaceae bacterium]|nr:hypothetical protein [Pseudohongiellaceae bacterium]